MVDERPVALVTGAGSPYGIGFATAKVLAQQGFRLVIASTTIRIHERAAELGDAVGHVADLTDPSAADALVTRALEAYGRLDALVNNAGMTSVGGSDPAAAAWELDDDGWRTA